MGYKIDRECSMRVLPDKLVRRVGEEVSKTDPVRANREIRKIGLNQPDLLGFVMEATENLSMEGGDLAIYLFYLVWEVFHRGGARFKRIPKSSIKFRFGRNQHLLEKLEMRDHLRNRLNIFPVLSQPYLIKYIGGLIMQGEEDSRAISEDEKGFVFVLIKSLIEALDHAARKA